MSSRARIGLLGLALVGLLVGVLWLVEEPGDDVGQADEQAPTAAEAPPAVSEAAGGEPLVGDPWGEPPPAEGWTARFHVRRWPDGAPVAAAEVRLETEAGVVPEVRATSVLGRLERILPGRPARLRVVVGASDYQRHDETLTDLPPDLDLVEVWLEPLTGWIGRAVTPLGEPVPGVAVSAWRHWTPRPAWLALDDEAALELLATEGSEPATVPARSDGEGYFYVEPFDTANVVDLVLALLGESRASAPLPVPLPFPGTRLPDLVVSACEPLSGWVVDVAGRPVPGAVVTLDRSPGGRGPGDGQVASLGNGTFRAPRHLGLQRFRVETPDHAFVQALGRGASLPADEDGWVRVGPDDGAVTVVVDLYGHLLGRVLDATTSAPLEGLAVVPRLLEDDGDWSEREGATTDRQGAFHIRVPPEDRHRRAAVVVDGGGYQPARADLVVEPDPRALPLDVFVVPDPSARTVGGMLFPPGGEDIRAFRITAVAGRWLGETKDLLQRPPTAGLDELRVLWTGNPAANGSFSFRTAADPDLWLYVVADRALTGRSLDVLAWGPRPLGRGGPVLPSPLPDLWVDVDVEKLLASQRYRLQQTNWDPLSGVTWSSAFEIAGGGDGRRPEARTGVAVPGLGLSWIELRLQRGPVSAPLAGTGGWVAAADLGPDLVLEVPPFHTLNGQVLGWSPADGPDLCVGFLGAAVPAWRSEYLGEADWFARPDAQGRFRLEAIPEGVYTFVLYRPAEEGAVEVLAQRAVTVGSDLFQLDIGPGGRPVLAPLLAASGP